MRTLTAFDRRAAIDLLAAAWSAMEEGSRTAGPAKAVTLVRQFLATIDGVAGAAAAVETSSPVATIVRGERLFPEKARAPRVNRPRAPKPVESGSGWWPSRAECAKEMKYSVLTIGAYLSSGRPVRGHILRYSKHATRKAWQAARAKGAA